MLIALAAVPAPAESDNKAGDDVRRARAIRTAFVQVREVGRSVRTLYAHQHQRSE